MRRVAHGDAQMSHVTYMIESCHTCEWVMAHIWMNQVTFMSHIWISYVTHTNESCHLYKRVKSRVRMSHVTHVNASCHTYGCVTPDIWRGHVRHWNESCHTHINKSCHTLSKKSYHAHINHSYHTYEKVTSHIRMSHATHANRSRHSQHLSITEPDGKKRGKRSARLIAAVCYSILPLLAACTHTPIHLMHVCMCARSSCVCKMWTECVYVCTEFLSHSTIPLLYGLCV